MVDKRYFICTWITSYQLLPPCLGYAENRQSHFIKNTVADFLYFHASERVLDTFVASCLAPEDATLRASFTALRDMSSQMAYEGSAAEIAEGVSHMVKVAEAEYHELSEAQRAPWLNFLPPPDLNKHSKLEVERILCESKAIAEQLGSTANLPYTPQSDYHFEEVAALDFSQSHEAVGVQIADVVAGATMRFFRDLDVSTSIAPELREAMMRLISEGDERTGFGLNQVVPTLKVRTRGLDAYARG